MRKLRVALLTLLLAPAAHAAYPPPGPTFESLEGDLRRTVRLSADSQRVVDYRFDWRVPCSDGRPLRTGMVNASERPALGADGTFAYESKVEDSSLMFNGRREDATYQAGFSGQLAADGQTVTVTAHVRVRSAHRTCEAQGIVMTTYLRGRPEAPERTDLLATGTYGLTGPRMTGVRQLHVSAGLREVVKVDFRWTIPCDTGTTINGRQRAYELPVNPATGRFRVSFRQTGKFKDGRRSSERFTIQGTFSRGAAGEYLVSGSFSVDATVRRKKRPLYDCGVTGSGFSGVLR